MMTSKSRQRGYSMIELMIVVMILAIIASILTPKFDVILQRAHQSKSKTNLGNIRSALSIYYTENNGKWPFANYPEGDAYYADGISLTSLLVPQYIPDLPTPETVDRMSSFNDLSGNFDSSAQELMLMNPPKDIYILHGSADYTPMLSSPYVYDNETGNIYIPNGNFDVNEQYFYTW